MSDRSAKATKTRRVLRAKEIIGVKAAKNRSADLVALTDQFHELKSDLKKLVAVLKHHHASMDELTKSRSQVAKHVSHMAEKSPMSDLAGHFTEGGSATGGSYAAVHATVQSRQKMYSDRYHKFVVSYAVEWEKVVVTRVSDSLRKAEVLRRDLDHYQMKVEALRKNVNVKMAKGKLVDPKESEKLKRNEDKLMSSRKEYEEFAAEVCALIEEVTERGWKDLHPLLIKLTQFDATLSGEEAKVLAGLNEVTERLKQIARKHGLKPEARLRDIESQSAQMVSTKDKERALEYEKTGALTYGESFDGAGGGGGEGSGVVSPGDSTSGRQNPLSPTGWAADAPAEGAPQSAQMNRNSSFASVGSQSSHPMSTNDMLTLASSAAPPPTLDDLNDAAGAMTISNSSGHRDSFSRGSLTRQSQSVGALPPLPPNTRNLSRTGSLEPDYGGMGPLGASAARSSSEGGLPLAPAPSAPPPPPPPAPALSMYAAPTDTALAPSSGGGSAYTNYQTHAPPPIQTGPPAPAHPWSDGGGGALGYSPQTQASGPNPFNSPPMNQYSGGGAPPMNQYGGGFGGSAPSSGGLMGGSTHSAQTGSTNPFDE